VNYKSDFSKSAFSAESQHNPKSGYHQSTRSQGGQLQQRRFNKDNSILEIAKM
jgi:hypothetical protein